ncbi:hypothetical protein FJZ21_03350 [Candidatus Pacearchaeota archaeon]|nr:hypothetical protein [Candidatus Pacearchaeota archaeon]
MAKNITKAKERKIEKEILGVLVFLAILVVVFIVASSFFKSMSYFEYQGLTFSKKKIGEIGVFHHSYYVQTPAGLALYNFYVRNDPRDNNIKVVGESDLMKPRSVVYLSINSDGLQECRYGPLAVGSLSSFITDNQMRVIAGNLNFWDAGLKRDLWATCENKPGNKVIEILKGNETQITIKGNCYRIEVANCEILEATEKLELESILNAKKVTL